MTLGNYEDIDFDKRGFMNFPVSKALLVYTMTSGLGDYIILGSLMRSVETFAPNVKCLIAHRANPHVHLWPYGDSKERFFNVYNPYQFFRLVVKLKRARRKGYTIFGLQMAPGSVQGFFFYLFLKRLKALDFIVDFNLINADIITPPKANYILDMHVNQVEMLLRTKMPKEAYVLKVPICYEKPCRKSTAEDTVLIGIHPWSRRGHLSCFVWEHRKWLELITFLMENKHGKVIVFGKDKGFQRFKEFIMMHVAEETQRISFEECSSVVELVEMIDRLDILISVNTSVVHIGYSLRKKMVILCGPSLDIWIPRGPDIKVVYDEKAAYYSDKCIVDPRFRMVGNIEVIQVIKAFQSLLL